jgi:predicted nucleic acid-binding Zn ribbon protein
VGGLLHSDALAVSEAARAFGNFSRDPEVRATMVAARSDEALACLVSEKWGPLTDETMFAVLGCLVNLASDPENNRVLVGKGDCAEYVRERSGREERTSATTTSFCCASDAPTTSCSCASGAPTSYFSCDRVARNLFLLHSLRGAPTTSCSCASGAPTSYFSCDRFARNLFLLHSLRGAPTTSCSCASGAPTAYFSCDRFARNIFLLHSLRGAPTTSFFVLASLAPLPPLTPLPRYELSSQLIRSLRRFGLKRVPLSAVTCKILYNLSYGVGGAGAGFGSCFTGGGDDLIK